MNSPRTTRRARVRFIVAASALLFGVAACDSVGNMFSPGGPASDAPARLALQATIPRFQQSAFTRLELRVTAQYERTDQSIIPLGSQRLPLSNETTQQVRASIELKRCLTDPQRIDASVEPAGCVVSLALTLLGDDRELDSFALTNLRLVPGAAAIRPQPVELFEIDSVSITLAEGAALPPTPLSIVAGNSLALEATLIDGGGAPVSGRTVVWSSTNSAVATVSDAGVVTGVVAGNAVITATAGGRSATVAVTIAPPTQRLEIVAVPGNGTGRILSNPAGIDCTLSAGSTSGTCAADFARGLNVVLSAAGQSATTAIFSGWTGACLANGAVPTCSLTIDAPLTTGASFDALALLELSPSGGSYPGITVSSTTAASGGALFNCDLLGFTGNCALPYLEGTSVTLTAAETLIARATTWSGCDSFSRTSCIVDLGTTPRAVVLQGTLGNVIRANLVDPTGLGRVTASNVGSSGILAPLNCGTAVPTGQGVCASGYPAGSTVTVTAIPGMDSRFLGWTDPDCSSVSGLDCVISSTTGNGADIVLDFGFELNPFRLTLELSGAGGGTVFDQLGDPLCTLLPTESSRRCELTFPSSTLLSLGGQPTGGASAGQFLGFGGDCPPGPGCLITVDQPRTVTAVFTDTPAMVPVRIVADLNNSGFGFFVSDLSDIECDVLAGTVAGSCTTMRAVGSSMTITAFDDEQILTASNHVFAEWAPGTPCAGSVEPVCTFTVGPLGWDFSAAFVPASLIAVDLDGFTFEAGTLGATVPGFRPLPTCVYTNEPSPVQCEFLVPTGSSMTLTATAATGTLDTFSASFCSWTPSGSGETCTFSVTGDQSGSIFIFSLIEEQFAAAQVADFSGWLQISGSRALN